MDNNEKDFLELAEDIIKGVRKAVRKVVEENAATGDSLVVEVNGEVKHVPAKELLKTLPEA